MHPIVTAQIEKATRARRHRRETACLLGVMALVVALCVSWSLQTTGVAYTEAVVCGYEAHVHSEECYEGEELTCTEEEHLHTVACLSNDVTEEDLTTVATIATEEGLEEDLLLDYAQESAEETAVENAVGENSLAQEEGESTAGDLSDLVGQTLLGATATQTATAGYKYVSYTSGTSYDVTLVYGEDNEELYALNITGLNVSRSNYNSTSTSATTYYGLCPYYSQVQEYYGDTFTIKGMYVYTISYTYTDDSGSTKTSTDLYGAATVQIVQHNASSTTFCIGQYFGESDDMDTGVEARGASAQATSGYDITYDFVMDGTVNTPGLGVFTTTKGLFVADDAGLYRWGYNADLFGTMYNTWIDMGEWDSETNLLRTTQKLQFGYGADEYTIYDGNGNVISGTDSGSSLWSISVRNTTKEQLVMAIDLTADQVATLMEAEAAKYADSTKSRATVTLSETNTTSSLFQILFKNVGSLNGTAVDVLVQVRSVTVTTTGAQTSSGSLDTYSGALTIPILSNMNDDELWIGTYTRNGYLTFRDAAGLFSIQINVMVKFLEAGSYTGTTGTYLRSDGGYSNPQFLLGISDIDMWYEVGISSEGIISSSYNSGDFNEAVSTTGGFSGDIYWFAKYSYNYIYATAKGHVTALATLSTMAYNNGTGLTNDSSDPSRYTRGGIYLLTDGNAYFMGTYNEGGSATEMELYLPAYNVLLKKLNSATEDEEDEISVSDVKFTLQCVENGLYYTGYDTYNSDTGTGYNHYTATWSEEETQLAAVDGEIELYGLNAGTFHLQETYVMGGYTLNAEIIEFTVAADGTVEFTSDYEDVSVEQNQVVGEDVVITLYNYNKPTYNLELAKVDSETQALLEGTSFRLYYLDESGTKQYYCGTKWTDNSGYVSVWSSQKTTYLSTADEENLLSFLYLQTDTDYYLEEVATDDYHYGQSTIVGFRFALDGTITLLGDYDDFLEVDTTNTLDTHVISFTYENDPIPVDMSLLKVDADNGNPLQGAQFQLYYLDEKGVAYYYDGAGNWTTKSATITTDEEGLADLLNVVPGRTYYLKEVGNPAFYVLPVDEEGNPLVISFRVNIQEEGYTLQILEDPTEGLVSAEASGALKIIYQNNYTATYDLPLTGSTDSHNYLLIGAAIMLGALGIALMCQRRREI